MRTTVKWVRLSELKTDERVNRPIDKAWVSKLIATWNSDVMGIPSVSPNGDGRYVIIDGQHRIEAIREMHSDDPRIQVEIVEGVDVPAQAYQFVERNHTRPVHPFQKFEKRVTAGENVPCAIVKVLSHHGLHLAAGGTLDKTVCAVVALEKIANSDGSLLTLSQTLEVLTGAWGTDPAAFQGNILLGVARFVATWPDAQARLTKKLAGLSGGPTGLIGKGRTLREAYGGTLANAIAEQLRLLHNSGLSRHKLDW